MTTMEFPVFSEVYTREGWCNALEAWLGQEALTLYESPLLHPLGAGQQKTARALYRLGTVRLAEDELPLYEVTLHPQRVIGRNRVGVNELIRQHLWQQAEELALVVFHYGDAEPDRSEWRLSFVAQREMYVGEMATEQKTEPKRYTYLLGEQANHRTVRERFAQFASSDRQADDLFEAFSVEKLSKEFFYEYRAQFEAFAAHLKENQALNGDERAQRDLVKKLLGRILFLYFVQKKGWLGVPMDQAYDTGMGNPHFMQDLFRDAPEPNDFYRQVLTRLFYDTLNHAYRAEEAFEWPDGTKVRVPFLNGGLFDENESREVAFPAALFEGLFALLDRFNFTIEEDSPQEAQVAVDPEMLGRLFESLLEANREKGAFYTPPALVHYMVEEALTQHLHTRVPNAPVAAIQEWVQYQRLEDALVPHSEALAQAVFSITIADPALGSGAFPMAILTTLTGMVEALHAAHPPALANVGPYTEVADWNPAAVKSYLIQHCIYGVDIDPGAIDIARLRFWLSLIIDEDTPKPLPNLDYKFMQGDSLLESFQGIALFQPKPAEEFNPMAQLDDSFMPIKERRTLKFEDNLRSFYQEQNTQQKRSLQQQFKDWVQGYIDDQVMAELDRVKKHLQDLAEQKEQAKRAMADEKKSIEVRKRNKKALTKMEKAFHAVAKQKQGLQGQLTQLEDLQDKGKDKPYFLWHTWFGEVFRQGGFDLVIGNPPYIQLQKHKHTDEYREEGYANYTRTGDIYGLFYERGYQLLKPGGVLSYITSNKWMRAAYGAALRKWFQQEVNIQQLVDFGMSKVFDTATVMTNILQFTKEKPQEAGWVCRLPDNWKLAQGLRPSLDNHQLSNSYIHLYNKLYSFSICSHF